MDLNIYSDLAEWLMEVEASTGPAGFDGQLTGMWCRHSELPTDLALDEVDQQTAAWDSLLNFAQEVKERLEDSDCSFEPILPPDSAPLRDRLTALADWSGGVLFGIGSAGQLDSKTASDEVQELLKDLAEICKLNVNDEGSDVEDSYIEIVEYLKVAAQTLYVELHPQAG